MKHPFLLSSFLWLLFLIIKPVFAAQWTPTFIIGGGGITQATQNQTLRLANTPEPGLNNSYTGNSKLYGAALFGLALERDMSSVFKDVTPRLGVELDYLRNNAIKGMVSPMVNVAPDFDQLIYTYDIQTLFLQATAKLVKEKLLDSIGGYLQAGVGAAGNRLSNYREYPPENSSAAPMLSPFHNHNTFNAAYSVGVGVIFATATSLSVSLGYKYIYAGKGEFDPSNVEQTNDVIILSPITYQFLVLGLSL